MKTKTAALITLVFLLFVLFALTRDSVARFAWTKQKPEIALFLMHNDPELAMKLGAFYFNGGTYNLEKAKRAYEKALYSTPGILWGYYQIARIYYLQGNYDSALIEINKELQFNPENLRSLYVRGLIYGFRNEPGDMGKAEKDFKDFTRWAPKEWAGYNDLSWILAREGKYKEIKDTISFAFREVPNADANPWLWNSLGISQLNLKEYEKAEISFRKSLEKALILGDADWRAANPGLSAEKALEGKKVFLEAVNENLSKAAYLANS